MLYWRPAKKCHEKIALQRISAEHFWVISAWKCNEFCYFLLIVYQKSQNFGAHFNPNVLWATIDWNQFWRHILSFLNSEISILMIFLKYLQHSKSKIEELYVWKRRVIKKFKMDNGFISSLREQKSNHNCLSVILKVAKSLKHFSNPHISESISLWLQSIQECAKSLSLASSLY